MHSRCVTKGRQNITTAFRSCTFLKEKWLSEKFYAFQLFHSKL